MSLLHSTSTRYNSLSICLHWLMLILIICVYACIELKGSFAKGSEARELLKQWHFMLGLSVFFLVWLRLIVRIISKAPAIEPTPPAWQNCLAKLMHIALYLFMIGMPLAGWFLLSASGKSIPFFGLELPALIEPERTLSSDIKYWHVLIGDLGYWLIGLHAAAALYHHYLERDNTLLRMLPKGKSKS